MKTKAVISGLYISFTAVLCFAQGTPQNHREQMNLKGSVKSIHEISYQAVIKLGKIQKGEKKRENKNDTDFDLVFDEKGNRLEENYYNPDGTLSVKHIYHYNEKGNIEDENYYDSDWTLLKWVTYTYSEEGNLSENRTYGNDYLFSLSRYSYDEKGNKIEQINYKLDNGILFWDFHYDSTTFYKFTFKYNEKGDMIETNSYDTDGNLNYTITSTYDNNGNTIAEAWYGSNGNIWTKKTYNEKGNETEYCSYDSKGNVAWKYTYVYEYDSQENWTKQTEFKQYPPALDKPTYILERKIEYY